MTHPFDIGTPDWVRTSDLRLRRPFSSSMPYSVTDMYALVRIRHRRLMIGSIAVFIGRQK